MGTIVLFSTAAHLFENPEKLLLVLPFQKPHVGKMDRLLSRCQQNIHNNKVLHWRASIL